jgi:hypothetical protein
LSLPPWVARCGTGTGIGPAKEGAEGAWSEAGLASHRIEGPGIGRSHPAVDTMRVGRAETVAASSNLGSGKGAMRWGRCLRQAPHRPRP